MKVKYFKYFKYFKYSNTGTPGHTLLGSRTIPPAEEPGVSLVGGWVPPCLIGNGGWLIGRNRELAIGNINFPFAFRLCTVLGTSLYPFSYQVPQIPQTTLKIIFLLKDGWLCCILKLLALGFTRDIQITRSTLGYANHYGLQLHICMETIIGVYVYTRLRKIHGLSRCPGDTRNGSRKTKQNKQTHGADQAHVA